MGEKFLGADVSAGWKAEISPADGSRLESFSPIPYQVAKRPPFGVEAVEDMALSHIELNRRNQLKHDSSQGPAAFDAWTSAD